MDNETLLASILEELQAIRSLLTTHSSPLLVDVKESPAPNLLKLPMIDQAASLPGTCSCGRGPVSFHPIGRKDATRMCVASPAACQPQQN